MSEQKWVSGTLEDMKHWRMLRMPSGGQTRGFYLDNTRYSGARQGAGWLAHRPGNSAPTCLTHWSCRGDPRGDKEMLSVKILEFLSSKRAMSLPRHPTLGVLMGQTVRTPTRQNISFVAIINGQTTVYWLRTADTLDSE